MTNSFPLRRDGRYYAFATKMSFGSILFDRVSHSEGEESQLIVKR